MIIIEIDSLATKSRNGISKKDGSSWTMHFQQAIFHGLFVDGFPSRYPRESVVMLDKSNPQPFPVGKYVIGADSYFFGEFDKFTFRNQPRLQPMAEFLADVSKQLNVAIKPALDKAA